MQDQLMGTGITLYGSNDPEELARQCAEDLAEPLSDPFGEEEFLVQSRGMGSWIQLQLADRLGIFARSCFRFPEATVRMILRGFLADCPEENLFTKEGMAWKILDLLPGRIERSPEPFASVARYLGEDGKSNGDRAFRLCRQIATLYDSYLAYRPDLIMNWQANRLPEGGDLWQGLLWQDLRAALGQKSLPELVRELGGEPVPARPERMPERLSVFGISTLPPIFLDVLQAYGRFRPLRIYALQPAPVMWGEVESEKEWKKRALKRAEARAGRPVREDDLHEERGNPLIGSLGRTGREFFNLLVDRDAHDVPLKFRQPAGDSLLARLQRWTFEVFQDQPEERKPLLVGDESVTINSCHGPMREAEVLRDYLLRRFAGDDTLRPRDVVVMMPDPEGYAPYLRATFGNMEDGMPEFFPYSIVDREPRRESHLVDAFFDLLEFFDGRATNREVLDLLDSIALRARFGLEDDDLNTFRGWIRDCHAHWGLDGDHRRHFGSTETDEHTWRHALDRMALGFSMRGNGSRTWEGVLPFDEMEGENVLRFAKLSRVLSSLSSLERQARGDRGLLEWAGFLERLSREFFPLNNETLLDRRQVAKAILALREEYAPLATGAKVPLRAIRYHLRNVLSSGTMQGSFLTRGVTFCGLRPMRSVSARVVCLIGMSDGAFPRRTPKPSFDLSGNRRPGDRSAREDDRYLFLETLWCARDFLYLSYVGQSIRQSQRIPPSVVVSELLDGLDKLADFGERGGEAARAEEAMVNRQALHPFGSANFSGDRLPLSYSADNLDAARALLSPDAATKPFLSGAMPDPEETLADLSLDDMVRFFQSPAQAFLRGRLGMSLWDEDSLPADSEPLELDGLASYGLANRLLGIELGTEEKVDLLALEKAKGSLPPGNLGRVCFNDAKREARAFLDLWESELRGEKSEPETLEGTIGGVRLRGELAPLVEGRQALYRCVDKIKGKDLVRAWIRHLWASALRGAGGVETRFFCSATQPLVLRPLASDFAHARLLELVELYRRGMREALPFFPNSSHAFEVGRRKEVEESEEDAFLGKAIEAARRQWYSSEHSFGEADDSANRLCFPKEPFEDPSFAELAGCIFGPLIEASGEGGEE